MTEHSSDSTLSEFAGSRLLIELLERRAYSVTWNADALREVVIQVYEYFARKRQEFDVRVRLLGTPFQRMVWNQLTRIPFGQTLSYRELAALVGKAGAFREVGQANGANPVSLIVPCHRIIGADLHLRGYEGGVDVKRGLLALERSLPWPQEFLFEMSQGAKGPS